METNASPASSYGVSEQNTVTGDLDQAAEEIAFLGYAVVKSGYSAEEIAEFGQAFDRVQERYVELHGQNFLQTIDELNGIRLPLALDAKFIEMAANPRILDLVQKLIRNRFVLNQQNGVINPPHATFNQGHWHRDLPYQHFVSSRPLAINALYCVDDFTATNGATLVLPATHTREEFPSDVFVRNHARQITAPAGSFIVLNCMLFHRGGVNVTATRRRGVNHVYTAAFIKQQIDIPNAIGNADVSPAIADLLGFRYRIPRHVVDFLRTRQR